MEFSCQYISSQAKRPVLMQSHLSVLHSGVLGSGLVDLQEGGAIVRHKYTA